MLYGDYAECEAKYHDAQSTYDGVLEDRELLFERTQPKSTQYDKERLSGGKQTNVFDDYLIQLERKRINERLEEADKILELRKHLLELKEEELRKSTDPADRVYVLRHLDHYRIHKIASIINYSESQIYRILANIRTEIDARK